MRKRRSKTFSKTKLQNFINVIVTEAKLGASLLKLEKRKLCVCVCVLLEHLIQ